MRFFIKHILKSGSPFEGKRNNQISIKKRPEKQCHGGKGNNLSS